MKKLLHKTIVKAFFVFMIMVCATVSGQTIFSENMGTPSGTTTIAANVFQNSGTLTYSGTADVRTSSASTGYTGASASGNVFLTNTVGVNFQISGINTSAYSGLTLSFGHFKSTTASNNELAVEVSTDGTNYTALTYSRATGTGTANWTLITPAGTIPSTANLRIRFRNTSATPQFRVDDVKLTGTIATPTPTVTTNAATSIATTSATLNATINANNLSATNTFDYGLTTSYTSTASGTPSTLSNNIATPVTSSLSGLSVNTQYHFRAVATVSATPTNGGDLAFYTLANTPDMPTVGNATLSTLDVTINSTTQNGNPAGTQYAIQETGSGNYVHADGTLGAVAWLSPGTVTLTGLPNNTAYTFQVKARNGDNIETVFGATASGSTQQNVSANLTLTGALSGFGNLCQNTSSALGFSFNGANLDGSDIVVGNLAGYSYSLTQNGTYTPTLNISYVGNSVTGQVVWVQFAPTAVQSYNGNIPLTGGGLAAPFNVAATGSGVNTPVGVTTGSSSAVTATGATLAGSAAIGCSPITAYGTEYSTTNNFVNGTGTQVAGSNLALGNFSVNISVLAPNTTYYYKSYATDGTGTVYGSQLSFLTSGLAAPNATAATAQTPDTFTANWDALAGATSYRLDVSTSATFGTTQNTTDLFFSEYVEGSSNNKYIEIYNGTGASVNLTDYQLRLYANGAIETAPTSNVTLSGTLANGSTIVYKNSGAAVYGGAATTNASVNYNGDDAIALYKISTASYVDIFGRIGEDPGTAWTAPGFTTLDKTLVRNANVFGGVTTNPASGFPTLSTQWTQSNIDIVSNLGSHTINNITPVFLPGYQDLTVNGTSQVVTGLTESSTYYYRVRAVSANSTSPNSNVITAVTAHAAATLVGINQVIAVVCDGTDATFNVTGLLPDITSVLTFNINGGAPQTANVIANGSGFGTFQLTLNFADNGHVLTVTSVDRSDFPGNSSTLTSDNTAVLSVNQNSTYYQDADADGFGNPAVTSISCEGAPAGYVANNTDCNDTDNTRHGLFDFYSDADGDGYGTGSAASICAASAGSAPAGYAVNSTDCDDTKASVHPGAVEIGYNLIDENCDGQIDEGFPPKVTAIQGAQCNTTLAGIDSQLTANLVAGAQGYRWRITTMSGPASGQIQFLDTALRAMKITQLANYGFGTQYKVEVAVYYAGFLQPFTPSTCTVTTPATTTQLTSCGQTLSSMSDVIYANIVPFATGYRFRITDPATPSNTQVIDRPIREFRMNLISSFVVQYGKSYNIEVALRNTDGNYLPYGNTCSVTTPLFPTTSLQDAQCDGYMVPTNSTQIYAISYPGAIGYVFQISGATLPGPIEITKSIRTFSLNDFPGLLAGATYNVRVRLVFNANDAPGPFGKICTIVTPGLARAMANEPIFTAVAFPNPFASNFNIDVRSSDEGVINMKVYDMTGRLLENIDADLSKMALMGIGERYPSGVYNVIVSQGENVKTLRVIKR